MGEPESNAEHDGAELERLVRFMTRKGKRFGLALATYVDPAIAAEVRAVAVSRANAAGQSVATVALTGGEDVLAYLAKESQTHDVLFVVALDPIAYDVEGQSPETLAIVELNVRRDELPQLVDARVVFWIVAEGYPQFARIAWDLLDVMLTRFEFLGAGELPQVSAVAPSSRPPWMVPSPGVDPMQLALQADSLAKAASAAKDDSTISDAAASAGQLYASIGQLDEAAHWLGVAASAYERLYAPLGDRDPQRLLTASTQRRRLAEVLRSRGATDEARNEAERSLALVRRATLSGRQWPREEIKSLGLLAELSPDQSRDRHVDDWDLLLHSRAGDGRAGGELILRHYTKVLAFFRARARARESAEYFVWRTFALLFEAGFEIRKDASFTAVLMQIARSVFARYLRARFGRDIPTPNDVFITLPDSTPEPDSMLVEREEMAALLDALSVDDQKLLELHYWIGLTGREISKVLAIPESTLRSRLQSARQRFARTYAQRQANSAPATTVTEHDIERRLESLRTSRS